MSGRSLMNFIQYIVEPAFSTGITAAIQIAIWLKQLELSLFNIGYRTIKHNHFCHYSNYID